MIQLTYKLTEPEIYQGLLEISKSRGVTNVLRIAGFVLLAVMLFITTASLTNGVFNFSLGFIFPIFLAVYLIFLSEITAKFQVPNLIKKKNPFTEEVNVKIYETGFKVKGQTFYNQFTWDKLNSIVATPDFFLLKETEVLATVLPKRVFTADDMIRFKNIVSNVNGPKVTLTETKL